jgi:hypothetical protein
LIVHSVTCAFGSKGIGLAVRISEIGEVGQFVKDGEVTPVTPQTAQKYLAGYHTMIHFIDSFYRSCMVTATEGFASTVVEKNYHLLFDDLPLDKSLTIWRRCSAVPSARPYRS